MNQFGGYTGMQPADFRDFVYNIARTVGFPAERIILAATILDRTAGKTNRPPWRWKNQST